MHSRYDTQYVYIPYTCIHDTTHSMHAPIHMHSRYDTHHARIAYTCIHDTTHNTHMCNITDRHTYTPNITHTYVLTNAQTYTHNQDDSTVHVYMTIIRTYMLTQVHTYTHHQDDSTVQSYLECVMPPGVGPGHQISVSIRNATYAALIAGCTDDMKKWGKQKFKGLPFGNCFM